MAIKTVFSSFCLMVGIHSTSLFAEPITESSNGFEIDWTNLTVRYVGAANAKDAERVETLRDIELLARRAGANLAYNSIRSVVAKKIQEVDIDRIKEDAVKAADELVKAASSTETSYFADGTVEVGFEAPLGQAVAQFNRVSEPRNLSAEYEEAKNSGIVFEVVGKVSPTANYRVLNQAGVALFSAADVSTVAFQSGLMGKWFANARESELRRAVGENPVTVRLSKGSAGTFVVDEESWRSLVNSNARNLQNARIAINLKN
jgi:hypothetical protein